MALSGPNCQPHYPCTLRPVLNKIRVRWTLPCDSKIVNLITKTATKWLAGRIPWTKGTVHNPGETEQDGARFLQATQNSAQCKMYELFIFHIIFSDYSWAQGSETMESKTSNTCVFLLRHRTWDTLQASQLGNPVQPLPWGSRKKKWRGG